MALAWYALGNIYYNNELAYKANDLVPDANVAAYGYDAQGLVQQRTVTTPPPSNGGIAFLDTTTASATYPARLGGSSTTAAKLPFFNVKDYGALGDGTTDDTTAIQAAINAAAGIFGIEVQIPPGTYKVSSTLTITAANVFLRGAGGDSSHDVGGFTPPTILRWAGTGGGTMLSFASPTTAGAQTCSGGGVKGVAFDAQGAGTGLAITSWRDGNFEDLMFLEFATQCVLLTASSGGGEARDSQRNKFKNVRGRQFSAGGCFLTLDGISTANASFNVFEACQVSFTGSATTGAFNLRCCDNNIFIRCGASMVTSGTALVCHAGSFSGGAAAANIFLGLTTNAAIKCNGTEENTYPSISNTFHYLDDGNGTPAPTLGTSATAQWSFTNGLHQRELFANLALGSGLSEAQTARDSLGGSLRIVNGSNDHVELALADLSAKWGVAVLGGGSGDLRFAVLTGSGKLQLPDTQTGRAGFNNTAPINKPTITGSRGGNAALASLLTALANYGLITDSTTA